MALRRSILIFEYLLASPGEWCKAGASLQREAIAMLTSIVSDLVRIPNVQPVVLIAADAVERVNSSGCFGSGVELIPLDIDPEAWLSDPHRTPESFAATMVIAPESGGILVKLLRTLQTGIWTNVRSLNIAWPLAEIFSDKLRTCAWLKSHQLPTPETRAISEAEANELRRAHTRVTWLAGEPLSSLGSGLGVLKPRNGVGCEGVTFIELPCEPARSGPMEADDSNTWILQPFVSGVPCSVGIIGAADGLPATILWPARQNLQLQNGTLVYCGGRIPCETEFASAIQRVAEKLAAALGRFSGYIGADLVVSKDGERDFKVTVIEINPRLCTSYVGYRHAANSNLASLILGLENDRPVHWRPDVIEFTAAGQILAEH